RSLRQLRASLFGCHILCVPIGPVLVALAEALFVLAVSGLRTTHRFCQVACGAKRSHANVDAPGSWFRDFLSQPGVTIGIAERCQRTVSAALRIRSAEKAVRPKMEDLAH